jgi:cell division protein FtsZ
MGYAVMGTAIGSGPNRALEAAQAAMASPLLEAGAIDGARGILINISGSSSLKLSEVNESSSLIQNAAHEEANIIFGAVLDETMGDQVKITVIATGFRENMPERRARMLSVTAPETAERPFVRVETQPPAVRFASEVFEQPSDGNDFPDENLEGETPTDLQEERDTEEMDEPAAFVEPVAASQVMSPLPTTPVSTFVHVSEPVHASMEAGAPEEMASQTNMFTTSRDSEEQERDNLDIPAFMRHGL